MSFAYFNGTENEQYLFYSVPQLLFTDDTFRLLTSDAKLLYGLLLNRSGLSKKNHWVDDKGRLYIYYTQEETCIMLNMGSAKAVRIFNELEKIGLIVRKKQGQGKPVKIYVLNFAKKIAEKEELPTNDVGIRLTKMISQDLSKSNNKTSQNDKSRVIKMTSQDLSKSKCNNNNIENLQNNTNLSSITPSEQNVSQPVKNYDRLIDELPYEDIVDDVHKQISYEYLITNQFENNVEFVDLIVEIIANILCSKNKYITVNKEQIPIERVIVQLRKIDETHIEYVFSCFKSASEIAQIKNIKAYLLTCLYNAPATMTTYYDSEVAYDFSNTDNNNKSSINYDALNKITVPI